MRTRSDSEVKDTDLVRGSPALSSSKYSPASSSSSHASRRPSPPMLGSRYRAGSDPSISRPDPASRLHPTAGEYPRSNKLSPRIGQFYEYVLSAPRVHSGYVPVQQAWPAPERPLQSNMLFNQFCFDPFAYFKPTPSPCQAILVSLLNNSPLELRPSIFVYIAIFLGLAPLTLASLSSSRFQFLLEIWPVTPETSLQY